MKIRIAALTALLVSSIGLGSPSGAQESEASLWADPVLVTTSQAAREASLALSPTNPNLMAICGPSGVPNTANNQSYFHRSTNGGRSWTSMQVEQAQTDPRRYAFEGGDCDVAFDAAGTMYSADTWLANLSIGHSTDGGQTWSGTSLAATSPIVDRPWLVGGPAGTIHVSYQDLQCCMPSAIWYTRSTDYGQTFLPAVPITTVAPGGGFTWEGNLVVSPNGQDLYLVYTRRQGPTPFDLDSSGPETVWVAASHNAGLTWTSHQVASMPNPASYLYPSIAMDSAGYLHVVFASKTSSDRPVWYAFSKDRAQTWTAPLAIERGGSGFSPWVAAGGPGEAAITWYGSPTPMSTLSQPVPWFFYAARVEGAHAGAPTVRSQTTTPTAMFTGSSTIPEFEMVRLDAEGRMHIAMAAFRNVSGSNRFVFYYQRELLPKVEGSGAIGSTTFAIDAQRDDTATAGTLVVDDASAGVHLEALTFDGLSLEKTTTGVTCTLTGTAAVTRAGSTVTEPFQAICVDAKTGTDQLSVATPSYEGGGSLTGGSIQVG